MLPMTVGQRYRLTLSCLLVQGTANMSANLHKQRGSRADTSDKSQSEQAALEGHQRAFDARRSVSESSTST